MLSFVGKLGDPELGGLGLEEFNRRQALYRQAEIAAMMDVPSFKCKAREIYGYRHLVNDVGGSLCELDEPRVIDLLAEVSFGVHVGFREGYPQGAKALDGQALQRDQNVYASDYPGKPTSEGSRTGIVFMERTRGVEIVQLESGSPGRRAFDPPRANANTGRGRATRGADPDRTHRRP